MTLDGMITETTDRKTADLMWRLGPEWNCPRCHSVNAGHREICRICKLDSALISGGAYCVSAQTEGKPK